MDLGFDVVDLPDCDPPAVGDVVPDFNRPLVTAESWSDSTLSAQTDDGPVVLVFHPMLGSFPATYVWRGITTADWVGTYGVRPIGITISTPYHARVFLESRGIDGRLFSDPANRVACTYDLQHDLDGMAGIVEPRPAVFVLDEDRRVTFSWWADRWPDLPDWSAVDEAVAAVAGVSA